MNLVKPTYRLERWSLSRDPETRSLTLVGAVYGHPAYKDDTTLFSEPVVGGETRKGHTFKPGEKVETASAHYILGADGYIPLDERE